MGKDNREGKSLENRRSQIVHARIVDSKHGKGRELINAKSRAKRKKGQKNRLLAVSVVASDISTIETPAAEMQEVALSIWVLTGMLLSCLEQLETDETEFMEQSFET